MKRIRSFFKPVLVFVLAQVAWVSLLALWIYWFISNYIIFIDVGDKLSAQIEFKSTNIVALSGGVVLLVGISFALSFIFRYLSRQLSAAKMNDDFIANVTHELKSPLASMQLSLETLQSRDVPAEKQKHFVELMLKDATRLRRLIDSILEISGLEENKIFFEYHVFNAEQLVREIVEEVRDQFKLTPETLETFGAARCTCAVNRDALRTVFVNLIDNSVKYTIKPLEISIRLLSGRKWFSIVYTDNGIGIPPKESNRVFGKFQRIYNRINPSVKGTGLGLYWVREIVRHHKGKISVFSEGPNLGTKFIIQLPVFNGNKGGKAGKLLRRNRMKEIRKG